MKAVAALCLTGMSASDENCLSANFACGPTKLVDAAGNRADVRKPFAGRGIDSAPAHQPISQFRHLTPVLVYDSPLLQLAIQSGRWIEEMSRSRTLVLVAVACCALQLFASRCLGQSAASPTTQAPATAPFTEQMLSSYDGQNVSSIQIAGQPQVQYEQLAPLLIQKPGEPFSKEKVDQTAAALKAKGNFTAVRIRVEPEADGIRVVFVLEPAVYIGIFEFPGAGRFPYSRLLQVSNYPVQTAFNAPELEADRKSLLTFFRQQGYFDATVETQLDIDSPHAVANVLFNTGLGRRARFDSTNIQGASPKETAHLLHKLTSVWARLRGAAIRPNKPYHYGTITRAQNYLRHVLVRKGYLNAKVNLADAEFNPETNQASIHFRVTTGVPTHITIKGTHIWSWTRKSLLPFYQGLGVNEETVDEGRQALSSYLQSKGFFNAAVNAEFHRTPSGDTVTYTVTKGKRFSVESVRFSGNSHISTATLMPSIAVEKERLFSHGKFSNKLLSNSIANITNRYRSEGYSGVKVTTRVVTENRNIVVSFHIAEGPRDIVKSLRIEGDDTYPIALNGLQIAAGEPYSQSRVQSDQTAIVARYSQAGYLTASFRETASEVSASDPHRINVVYHIYEGPRVVTGKVLTLGRDGTEQRLIDRDLGVLRPDQPLTEGDMLNVGTRLYDHTGVFDWAEVDPKRPVTTQTSEDVLVKVHGAKQNEFTYGVGFEVINRGGSIPSGTVALPSLPPVGLPSNFTTGQKTFYGPRGTAEYTRNNLWGKGDSLSLTAFAGRLDQRGAIYFIDPNVFWTHWKATSSFSIQRDEENPIFSFQQELTTLELQKPIDRSQRDLLFLRYEYDRTNLTRVLIPDLVLPEDRNVRLSTLAANVTRDTRDNPLDEHHGVLRSLELDLNTKKLGSSVNFAKLTGQLAFYKTKFANIVWADSLRIGLEQPFGNSSVPLSERFFTGGANSLRGYPLDGAGPQRPVSVCGAGENPSACKQIQVPKGGNELLLLNSEARIPLPFKEGLRIVPFYDGGNVFPLVGFHQFLSLYSNNVGLGIQYSTPVGPIRFDVGRNLNPVPGIGSMQYFVSIGQAF